MNLIDRDKLVLYLNDLAYSIAPDYVREDVLIEKATRGIEYNTIMSVIEAIDEMPTVVRECGRDEDGRCKMRACNLCDKYRKQLKNQWTPCSERMPKKPLFSWDGYIVQKNNVEEPFSAFWDGEKWMDDEGNEIEGIIAWQPLPPKYEG